MSRNGNPRIPLEGRQIHHWRVDSYLGDGHYLCQCVCGVTRSIAGKALSKGDTKSCGCKRESWKKEERPKWFVPPVKYE